MIVYKGRIGLIQLVLLSIWTGLLGGAMGVYETRSSYDAGYSAAQLAQVAPAAGDDFGREILTAQQGPGGGACVYDAWIGNSVDETAVRETKRPYRVLGPGASVTMDYNPERIIVDIDKDGIVTGVHCG